MTSEAATLHAAHSKTGKAKRIKAITGRSPAETHDNGPRLAMTQPPPSSSKSDYRAIRWARPRILTCLTNCGAKSGSYTHTRREASHGLPETARSTTLGQGCGISAPALGGRSMPIPTRQTRGSCFFLAAFSHSISSISRNVPRKGDSPRSFGCWGSHSKLRGAVSVRDNNQY